MGTADGMRAMRWTVWLALAIVMMHFLTMGSESVVTASHGSTMQMAPVVVMPAQPCGMEQTRISPLACVQTCAALQGADLTRRFGPSQAASLQAIHTSISRPTLQSVRHAAFGQFSLLTTPPRHMSAHPLRI